MALNLPQRWRDLGRLIEVRSQRALLLAAVTGAVTGLGVAGFDWVTRQHLLDRVATAPVAVQVLLPTLGLAIAAAALWFLGGRAAPSTSDEYIRNFHEEGRRLDLSAFWARILGGVATLGFGGAMGFEGPSLYIGAATGSWIQRRWSQVFSREDAKLLMVAGAAAGVAAIFKAPATGAVFALEVPYRDDTARRMLLPALLAAAVGYLVFVSLLGTEPLFAVAGSPPFDLRELGGAVILGVVCGLGARGFAGLVRAAKRLSVRGAPIVRVLAAGTALAGLGLASARLFGDVLALGAGYRSLQWITEPGHGLSMLVALFAFRLAATSATVAGGGVGGLFVPLVIAGAITGQGMATVVGDPTTLFPLIGVAAFLGAGYRTPLAGVMFVAETTGRPGFVVPGLIASVASQLVMGDASVSPYQVAGRVGHLERRFRLPISSVIRADVLTVPPEASLSDFYEHHLLLNRQAEVAVVERSRFIGMVSMYDLRDIPPSDWAAHTVADVIVEDWPTITPDASLEDAVRLLERSDVDTLPVLDGDTFVGLVTTADITRFDQILDQRDDHPV